MTTAATRMPVVRDRPRRNARWRLAAALELLVAAVATSLTGLFDGGGWWLLCVGIGALVFAAAAVLRAMGVPALLASLGSALLASAVLFVAFGGLGTLDGVVPTRTWEHFAGLTDSAFAAVRDEAVPSGAGELLFFVAVGAAILAVALDALAAHAPALCALPLVVVLLVPTFLLNEGVGMLALACCAAAYLLVLRQARLSVHPGDAAPAAALRLAAVAVVAALVVGVSAPGFERVGRLAFGSEGLSVGAGVNSLIDVGKDLNRPFAVATLSYTTSSSDPPYLRLTSLEDFTGAEWRHRQKPTGRIHEGVALPPVAGTEPSIETTAVTTNIRVRDVTTPWLPAPYPASVVRGLEGTWAFDTLDGTVLGVDTTASEQSYTMVSLTAQPTQEQLRNSNGPLPSAVLADLRLPEEVPDVITRTTREVAAGAVSRFDEALALQAYFQSGQFSYSLEAPSATDRSDGMEVMARFLRDKKGYCVHFASAMAVMARVLGIPSRIALGYLPGAPGAAVDGESVYTVTSDDLHAWPELFFPGVGWVAFEPTVSRGVPSQFADTEAATDSDSAAPTDPTEGAVATRAPAAPDVAGTTAEDAAVWGWDAAGRAAAAVLLSAIVLLAPAATRVLVRRRRLGRIARGGGDVWLAWRELCDSAQDLGIRVDAAETPRAFAARLMPDRPAQSPDRLAVDALRMGLEHAAYGGGVPSAVGPETARELTLAVSGIAGSVSAGARWRARLMPVSLLRVRPRAQVPRTLPA